MQRVTSRKIEIVTPSFNGGVEVAELTKGRSVTADPDSGLLVVDSPEVQRMAGNNPLDWNTWLRFCAPCYQISADVNDYILFPAQIMISDLPNRNAVGFPLKTLVSWHRDAGMAAYRMWKGQPVFVDHANKVDTAASGVIVDVSLRRLAGYGTKAKPLYKLQFLMAVDRTKNPTLAKAILEKKYGMVSMGAYVSGYICSVCEAELGECSHLDPDAPFDFYLTRDGQLVFRQVYGITPFECSVVGVGAFPSSTFQQVIDVSTGDILWNDR